MTHILVIEDNRNLAEGLRRNLELESYSVDVARTAAQGLRSARMGAPDLVILDLLLPDGDGFQLLSTVRREGSAVPVLILTARSAEADMLNGFRLGADDYLTKPFRIAELLARVRALLRRAARADASAPGAAPRLTTGVARFGRVEVDTAACTITNGGVPVPLRPREYDLLLALLARPGEVVSRAQLLRDVWGYDPMVMSRTVDTHILELRRKLEPDPAAPAFILTVRTRGYRLVLADERNPGGGQGLT